MQLKILPARAGFAWIRAGIALFFSRPASFLAFFSSFMLLIMLLAQIPLLGSVTGMALMPALTLGMMAVSNEAVKLRRIQQGQLAASPNMMPPLAMAWLSVRVRALPLLKMGLIFTAGFGLVLLGSTAVDGGVFAKAYMGNTELTRDIVTGDDNFRSALLLSTLLYLPLAALFWFAPPLMHWKDFAIGKSLFYSVYATVKNWRAFTVYILGWSIISAGSLGVTVFILGAMLSVQIASLLLLPLVLMLSCIFLASTFVTFIECFKHPELSSPPRQ